MSYPSLSSRFPKKPPSHKAALTSSPREETETGSMQAWSRGQKELLKLLSKAKESPKVCWQGSWHRARRGSCPISLLDRGYGEGRMPAARSHRSCHVMQGDSSALGGPRRPSAKDSTRLHQGQDTAAPCLEHDQNQSEKRKGNQHVWERAGEQHSSG